MKTLSTLFFRLLIIALLVGFTGCDKDDDVDSSNNLSTSELLIGTWTVSDFDLSITVGNQSFIDYLIEEEGLTPSEAADLNALFEAFLGSELTGTLTINSDKTYVSNFGEESTSGTWSLSADEKTLTLVEEGETIIITIDSVSSNTLKATISESSPEDIDEDPQTPDVIITIDIMLTLTK
ncbi:lipocalin-like domain-containing protein [Lentiprolixibacter aurantiacus]|uniref:DUF4923 family protein n=1 Tax=Lentiprolixibacter aurantiacus TaxID=2993939 RepID=A0AAE3MIK8_9FLAO|nr:DUF4923 family protein [Lentiprolixibacter aurantiacus]MCX2718093.1 DUF4923 family protein [Lentiprolixibacter aurantiacus]